MTREWAFARCEREGPPGQLNSNFSVPQGEPGPRGEIGPQGIMGQKVSARHSAPPWGPLQLLALLDAGSGSSQWPSTRAVLPTLSEASRLGLSMLVCEVGQRTSMLVTVEVEGTLALQGLVWSPAGGGRQADSLGVTLSSYFRVTRVRGGQWGSQARKDGR